MDIILKKVDENNSDLHYLIQKLDRELNEKYPNEGIFGVDFNDEKVKKMIFVVAFYDNKLAGCGALRPLENKCIELKRFYVDKIFRNKGIASKILSFLENEAILLGYEKIRLETGPKQPDAIHVFEKFGYYQIDLFGEYLESSNEYSICFEKKLI